MYAIMYENELRKDILSWSLCERSDEKLTCLLAVAAIYRAEFPDTNYYIVKIDMEIVK